MPTTPRARVLSRRLKEARAASGHSVRTLAAQLGWSTARVSRLENVRQGVNEADVSALLAMLGVIGNEREQLLKMVRELDQPAWWELQPGLPDQLTALIDAEQRAESIVCVTPVLFPGLVQTRQYARSVIQSGQLEDAVVEQRVTVRIGRQGILDKTEPVQYTAYIDEPVLERPVGGDQVAAEQLRYLTKLAKQPNITFRVVPMNVGYVPGLDSMWTLLTLPRDEVHVHIEGPAAGLTLNDTDAVANYWQVLSHLSEVALGAEESITLIDTYAQRFEQED